MNFLAYDGPLMTVLRKIGTILIADVLFLLCCLPLVTSGASLCALFSVVEKNLKHDRGYVWTNFFVCFRQNWRQTLPAGIGISAALGLFLLDIQILQTFLEAGRSFGNLYVLFYLPLALVIVYAVWLFALIARFENTLRHFLINAAALMFRHFSVSVLMLALLIIFALLTYILPLSVLVTPVLSLWLISGLTERVFTAYMTDEEKQKEVEKTGGKDHERENHTASDFGYLFSAGTTPWKSGDAVRTPGQRGSGTTG